MSEQVGSVTRKKSSDFYGGIRFKSSFTIRWELEDKTFLKIDIICSDDSLKYRIMVIKTNENFIPFFNSDFQKVGIIFYPPKPHRSRGTGIEFWTPCDKLYQWKMPTKFLGDLPFFCVELNIWEIAFSPTKGEYNEYNCILVNIVHEVSKYVSDISWGYVIHI